MRLRRTFLGLFSSLLVSCVLTQSGTVAAQRKALPLPRDQWAMLQAAARIEDPATRLQAIEQFSREYPESPFKANVLRLRFMSHRELTQDHDFLWNLGTEYVAAFTEATEQVTELYERNPLLANMYSEVAFEFAHRGSHLDGALEYALRALALVDESANLPSPKVSKEQWVDGMNAFRGQILNAIGRIQYQRGAFGEAEAALTDAVALIPEDAPTLYHLGKTLLAQGREESAVDNLLQAAGSARPEPEVRDILVGIYSKQYGADATGRLQSDIEAAGRRVRAAEAERVTANRMNVPAPEFTVSALDGSLVSLSDLTEKVVVLNFWATWCPPCRKEMPVLEELWGQYKDSGDVTFLIVSVDQDKEKVRPYIEGNKYSFPVFYGGATAQLYKIISIPTTLVIDKDGIAQYKHAGYRPEIKDLLTWEIEALR